MVAKKEKRGYHDPLRSFTTMIWFFERSEESLRVETRYDNDAREIVVVIHWPDGREQTERFTSPEACRIWLLAWERTLEGQRWKLKGPPVLLPYGWLSKR
jgi:hypothetical protein